VLPDGLHKHATAVPVEDVARIVDALLDEVRTLREKDPTAGQSLWDAITYWNAVLREIERPERAMIAALTPRVQK
jgi:hypothetical protein